MDIERGGRLRLLLVLALVSIVVGGTIDLLLDEPERWLSFHVVFETMMIAGALVMATTLWLGWWHAEQSAEALRRSLEERREERDVWRESARKALEGLGRAIDEQFRAWELTPSEREVALLLLKGYSHKGIAKLTGRSHQTVRQHAAAAYRKASVSGRAELSAFFLQDLMLPEEAREVMQERGEARGPAETEGATPRDRSEPGRP